MASAEAYIAIARLVLSCGMELHNATVEDLSVYHIRLIGYPKKAKYTVSTRGEIMVKVAGGAPLLNRGDFRVMCHVIKSTNNVTESHLL
jgi:hypothetical protein